MNRMDDNRFEKMPTNRSLVVVGLVGFLLFGYIGAFAAEEKVKTKSEVPVNLRCERYLGRELSVLKTKMTESCDLSKPFSTSLSVFAGDDTYLYCCHAKAE